MAAPMCRGKRLVIKVSGRVGVSKEFFDGQRPELIKNGRNLVDFSPVEHQTCIEGRLAACAEDHSSFPGRGRNHLDLVRRSRAVTRPRPRAVQRGRAAALTGAVAAAVVALARPAVGAEVRWLGGTGNWSDPAKWSTGTVPVNTAAARDDVLIDGGNAAASAVAIGPGSSAWTLRIDADDAATVTGGALTVGDRLTANGRLTLQAG